MSTLINNLEIKLYYFGTQKCNSGHSWGPGLKDHFKIHYIHEGKGIFKINGRVYSLRKGQGFLIPPNAIAYYKADEVYPWNYSWCAFDGARAEEYLMRANLTSENPVFVYDKDDALIKCFEQMFEVMKLGKSVDLRLQSLLYLFIATIIDETAPAQNTDESAPSKNVYINKAISFIQANYSHNIRITEIADFVRLDRKYLSYLFKSAIGVSLQDYLINFRLNKAKMLLRHTAHYIGDISRSVGYDNPLIFSRIFKKNTGLSPSQYRNNYF